MEKTEQTLLSELRASRRKHRSHAAATADVPIASGQ